MTTDHPVTIAISRPIYGQTAHHYSECTVTVNGRTLSIQAYDPPDHAGHRGSLESNMPFYPDTCRYAITDDTITFHLADGDRVALTGEPFWVKMIAEECDECGYPTL